MTSTPHLDLPLLAAAQAQKHVTHNEALASLDALVHLAVKERNRVAAPGSPQEGDRYLLGSDAAGVFAGHGGEIALFDLGSWRFLVPRPGWRAYVEAEDAILVFDGAQWRDLGRYTRELSHVERLGIGTGADDLNRLAAKLNAALFTALGAGEGGTGDLRFVLNKEGAASVLSQLYQSGYSGRAETGLIGGDDFRIRVSPDGSAWHDALRVDAATGLVSFPSGHAGETAPNLLVNGHFLVNQRPFAGGALAAGASGFDRWKAGPGGCTIARTADGTVTLTGPVEQVVDVAQAAALTGASSYAGGTLTLSVENPSAPIPVVVGTKAATIPAGSGRRSATVTLDASETGHVTVRLHPASACTFARVRLERGAVATPWSAEPIEITEARCRRYYQRIASGGGMVLAQRVSGNLIDVFCPLPTPMRAAPALLTSGFAWSGAAPSGNQIAFFDNAAGLWAGLSGGLALSLARAGAGSAVVRLQAGTSFSGSPGAVGALHLGASAFIALQAEP
ncbi:DUF2793 domain-containing protein [Microvirga lenta]|uniref:DUF2793 domain-containing protein n=1 Tax=Microvirga lenta TaxID=2881337 RepID=UPI001CFFE1C0|nr:DUF2793 domain-containing protein [Microvirga lenta]MCB5176270.1 DUF2793 domain-containing protein [Microvirga lenta]